MTTHYDYIGAKKIVRINPNNNPTLIILSALGKDVHGYWVCAKARVPRFLSTGEMVVHWYSGVAFNYFSTREYLLPQRYVKGVNHLRKETSLPPLLSKASHLERNGPRSIILQILGAWAGVIVLYGVVETLTLSTSPKLISQFLKTVFNALIERYGANFKAVESGKTISRIMSLTLVLQRNAEWFTDDFVPVSVAVVLIWFLHCVPKECAAHGHQHDGGDRGDWHVFVPSGQDHCGHFSGTGKILPPDECRDERFL